MYLLTIKDGLGTRHIGPYPSPKHASDDLERVLQTCSDRARWQIHALEPPIGLVKHPVFTPWRPELVRR